MKRCCSSSSYNICPAYICQISKSIFGCEEPTEDEEFSMLIKEHGIKTIVNTRVPDEIDYVDRTSFARKNGVACINFPICSLDIVSCDTLKLLLEKIQQHEEPILFLGRSGRPTASLALWYHAICSRLSEEELIEYASTLSNLEKEQVADALKVLSRTKPAGSSR